MTSAHKENMCFQCTDRDFVTAASKASSELTGSAGDTNTFKCVDIQDTFPLVLTQLFVFFLLVFCGFLYCLYLFIMVKNVEAFLKFLSPFRLAVSLSHQWCSFKFDSKPRAQPSSCVFMCLCSLSCELLQVRLGLCSLLGVSFQQQNQPGGIHRVWMSQRLLSGSQGCQLLRLHKWALLVCLLTSGSLGGARGASSVICHSLWLWEPRRVHLLVSPFKENICYSFAWLNVQLLA